MSKITPELKALFDQMPGAWGCKDKHSVFMYANEEYAKIIGVKHKEDIIGKTDFDMPCDTVNAAQLFQNQDKKVIQHLTRLRILDIHPFAGREWKAYIFTKTPLYNDQQQCIGTIFHGVNITNTSTIEIGAVLSRIKDNNINNELLGQSSYMLNKTCDQFGLTDRQPEVLFYILRGKTVKQIGNFLEISPRTVDEHLEQLRYKFNVSNKHALIDQAISYGFLNIIPETLFRQQLSIELTN